MDENKFLQLRQYLEAQSDIVMAFLFGSEACGQAHRESDVDLAIYFTCDPNLERVHELWGDLESIVGKPVDLVVLNNARVTIADAALRGRQLVVRDERLWLEKMLATSREAEDFRNYIADFWRLRERYRGESSLVTPKR